MLILVYKVTLLIRQKYKTWYSAISKCYKNNATYQIQQHKSRKHTDLAKTAGEHHKNNDLKHVHLESSPNDDAKLIKVKVQPQPQMENPEKKLLLPRWKKDENFTIGLTYWRRGLYIVSTDNLIFVP